MNRDDIIRMAREAGMAGMLTDVVTNFDEIERFAALVTAAEREACAKLCDEMACSPALSSLETYRTLFIADAIRARGEL